ncbi:MAG: universal stress protein [Myxococcota bacterium]
MIRFDRILVPVDFSPHSRRAVDLAVGLAKTFSATIHLLHAYHLSAALTAPDPMVLPAAFWEDVRDSAARKLEKTAELVTREGVTVESHLSSDPPSAAIERAARELSADLIVMGTRGLTGLKHILLGSVAERTVRTAPCPVLTVRD